VSLGSFDDLWDSLLPIGREPSTGGYRRFAGTDADRQCRDWFTAQAGKRGLDVEADEHHNLWAWWGDSSTPAVVTGSHLDSVPDGGAYDGPLGVVSAFAALDQLRADGLKPQRPLGIVVFDEEEGSTSGVSCMGSRRLTGAGAAALDRIGAYVELHIEQGRALADLDAPVGVATDIWPHGRWLFTFTGRADHAGTTRMEDRNDPMLTYAMTALAANKRARLNGARATFGRVEVEPNATNAIPSTVRAWLDARAPDEPTLNGIVDEVSGQAHDRAARDGTSLVIRTESTTAAVEFDPALRDRLAAVLGDVPLLPTAAGHDAGILAQAGVPSAMLFVRNPTGVSHSPQEYAERGDCLAGVDALARVLAELLTR
jgi:beta-ureidopropionase / N-carbamoyl-L-amino-acid hydrolase